MFTDLLIDGVTPSGLGKEIRPNVHVTVSVMTPLGHSEEPGSLERYGPIDPNTGRRLAGRAPSFTRLLTHPETGCVLTVRRDRYKVPNRTPQLASRAKWDVPLSRLQSWRREVRH